MLKFDTNIHTNPHIQTLYLLDNSLPLNIFSLIQALIQPFILQSHSREKHPLRLQGTPKYFAHLKN